MLGIDSTKQNQNQPRMARVTEDIPNFEFWGRWYLSRKYRFLGSPISRDSQSTLIFDIFCWCDRHLSQTTTFLSSNNLLVIWGENTCLRTIKSIVILSSKRQFSNRKVGYWLVCCKNAEPYSEYCLPGRCGGSRHIKPNFAGPDNHKIE